jgi:hypothetical protein
MGKSNFILLGTRFQHVLVGLLVRRVQELKEAVWEIKTEAAN